MRHPQLRHPQLVSPVVVGTKVDVDIPRDSHNSFNVCLFLSYLLLKSLSLSNESINLVALHASLAAFTRSAFNFC